MERLYGPTKQIITILYNIQHVLFSLIAHFGPFVVAGLPASFSYFGVYTGFTGAVSETWAMAVAVIAAISFEAVGIIVAHVAVDLYDRMVAGETRPVKFWLVTACAPFYVLGVWAAVYTLDNGLATSLRTIGFIAPVFTMIVYTALAIRKAEDLTQMRVAEKDEKLFDLQIGEQQTEADFRRQLTLTRAEMRHAEKLAKIQSSFGPNEQPNDEPNDRTNYERTNRTFAGQSSERTELPNELAELPDFGPNDVMNVLNLGKTQAYEYIKRWKADDLVRQTSRGRYTKA